jgi:hypothetical protein
LEDPLIAFVIHGSDMPVKVAVIVVALVILYVFIRIRSK